MTNLHPWRDVLVVQVHHGGVLRDTVSLVGQSFHLGIESADDGVLHFGFITCHLKRDKHYVYELNTLRNSLTGVDTHEDERIGSHRRRVLDVVRLEPLLTGQWVAQVDHASTSQGLTFLEAGHRKQGKFADEFLEPDDVLDLAVEPLIGSRVRRSVRGCTRHVVGWF